MISRRRVSVLTIFLILSIFLTLFLGPVSISNSLTNEIDDLISVLQNSNDWKQREKAAIALGKLRNNKAVGALIEALNFSQVKKSIWKGEIDSASSTRKQAVIALGNIGDKKAVKPLIAMVYTEQDPKVKMHIAVTLGKLGDRKAIPALTFLLNDPSWRVASKARNAIKKISEKIPRKTSVPPKKTSEQAFSFRKWIYHIAQSWFPPIILVVFLFIVIIVLLSIVFSVYAEKPAEFFKRFSALASGVVICAFLLSPHGELILNEIAEGLNFSKPYLFLFSFICGVCLVAFLDIIKRTAKESAGICIFIIIVSTATGINAIFYFKSESLRTLSSIISFGGILGALIYLSLFFRFIEDKEGKSKWQSFIKNLIQRT